jgi:MYXO-CTERM domain-containing protein
MRTSAAVGVASLLIVGLPAADAAAFCRTTTCPLEPAFSPSVDSCYPEDFATWCATMKPTPAKILPLFWRNHCVSYDLHADANGQVSNQVAYTVAAQIASASFAKWTLTECPVTGGRGRASIDVRDLGPVACDEVNYNEDQGNQHVIIFRDQGFVSTDSGGAIVPDPANANTLGLTTVTFDADTGELYDADIQINSKNPLATGDTVPPDGYDLQSILTHEAGHFLGLAHSPIPTATMFASYTLGSASKRILSDDDMAGICTIYPPDGTRAVDPSVSSSGFIMQAACDPTPRHGFQSACSSPEGHGCAVTREEQAPPALAPLGIAIAATIASLRRRRGRTADRLRRV